MMITLQLALALCAIAPLSPPTSRALTDDVIVGGSGTLDLAPDLSVDHSWLLLQEDDYLGTYPCQAEVVGHHPVIVELTGMPWGTVYLEKTDLLDQPWNAYLAGLGPFPVTWDSAAASLRLEAGPFVAFAHYNPAVQPTPVSTNPGRYGRNGVTYATPMCEDGLPRGVRLFFLDEKGIPAGQRNWIQFTSVRFKWTGLTVDADIVSGVASGDHPVRFDGNAGNPMAVDGGTVYVDSSDPTTTSYEDGPNGKDIEALTFAETSPGITDAVAAAQQAMIPPSTVALLTLDVTYEYTAYLEINGSIVYRYDWTFTEQLGMPDGERTAGTGTVSGLTGSAVQALGTDHAAAKTAFEAGIFTGAPKL